MQDATERQPTCVPDRVQDLARLLAVGYLRLRERDRAEAMKAPTDLVAWVERNTQ